MTDIERLRKDIIDYLEEESFMIPDSLVLAIDGKRKHNLDRGENNTAILLEKINPRHN